MQETILCPVCSERWPVYLLADHCAAHFVSEQSGSELDAKRSGSSLTSSYSAGTGHCGKHQGRQTLGEQLQLEASVREQVEFEKLQAVHGFSGKRKGKCFRCQKDGHRTRDFNPSIQRQLQQVVATEPEAILKVQKPANFYRMQPDVITLLQQCLAKQSKPAGYTALLSGAIDHYQTESGDTGWGCGWRNIQMQLSYVMQHRPEAIRSILGGGGFVPDITALQAWLECAWKDGFDPPGAEQLGNSVQASRKWIGTTECAALLRYWGIRAQIVDFQSEKAGQQRNKSHVKRSADGTEIHHSVECNGCGQAPLKGPRYKSQVMEDYDLCKNCHNGNAHAVLAPFLLVSEVEGSLRTPEDSQKFHQQMASWVWKYFSEGSTASGVSKASMDCQIYSTGKPPLYFQHAGHSRTIVGIERKDVKGQMEYTLLVLDPGTNSGVLCSALASKAKWQYMVKRGVHTLRKSEYQLLYMEDGIASGLERSQLKLIQRKMLVKY